jgi:hypothetical protein
VRDPIATTAANANAAPATPTAPTPDQALQTLTAMQQAYASGDLGSLMALFASRPSGPSRQALQGEYQRLFDASRERSLQLHDLVWLLDEDTAIGLGRFDATVTRPKDTQPRRSSGGVRVELRLEDGVARIVRLTHEGDRGS